MKLKLVTLLIILSIAVILFSYLKNEKQETMSNEILAPQPNVLLIIAAEGFQDLEYQGTRKALEEKNIKVTVASSIKGKAIGKFGQEVNIDQTIDQVEVNDFEAIVFIGGPGAVEYINNVAAQQLAQAAIEKDKVLGAICIAPSILAQAGVLKDKKATVWSSDLDQSNIKILKDQEVEYVDQSVVVDGKIVTANGPAAAEEFGQTIAELLK
ncbi:DJ-1/PfpI family protein [Patescibacteria group bacterium]|nr:DJ-1/PfpI family protein [Patescibacteria group bacterium]